MNLWQWKKQCELKGSGTFSPFRRENLRNWITRILAEEGRWESISHHQVLIVKWLSPNVYRLVRISLKTSIVYPLFIPETKFSLLYTSHDCPTIRKWTAHKPISHYKTEQKQTRHGVVHTARFSSSESLPRGKADRVAYLKWYRESL